VIYATEDAISFHLTASQIIAGAPINPASVRAAIRRLREALKPFVRGWVDDETASLVPADLDAELAVRDQEIAKSRLPPAKRRDLTMLCGLIAGFVRQFSSAHGEIVSEQDMLRYIDAALNFARIRHPNLSKHRDRLAALVFPNR
jgi:hypothetical protein